MRTPHNDTLAPTVSARTCVVSRDKGERQRLIRLALDPDGRVFPDVRARAPGRGAWVGVPRVQLDQAVAKGKLKGALARAFKGPVDVPADLGARVEAALQQDALDRLGLEARSGAVLTGSERIAEAARRGQLHLLLHASDAADDGRQRLAQAWRVGRGEEGSGRQGLALSVPRPILSVALGRENVVHIGITDARAAERCARAVDRWHAFIGRTTTGLACESTSQEPEPDPRERVLDEGLSDE